MATVSMPPGQPVPEEFLDTFRDNFDLVDADKDGMITREEAATLFRGLGQTPTESEMKELSLSLPGTSGFEDFTNWFAASYKQPNTELEIAKAFRVFDLSNSGVLSISKFRELLSNLGDAMSSEDV